MSQELERLKKRLLRSGPSSDFTTVINLCEVMRIVGGYEQLMNMSIPAMNTVLEYIQWVNEQERKQVEKAKRK